MNRRPFEPKIPARLRNVLAPFTAYPSGWCRWYGTKMVHVCGKKTPLDQIEDRWIQIKQRLDGALANAPAAGSILSCAARFYQYLQERVETGSPKPLTCRWAPALRITGIRF